MMRFDSRSQRKRATAQEVYRSVRACVRAAPLPSPHIRLRRRITTLLLLAAVIIPRRSLSFSTPPSLPSSPPPPPPSLLPSFTPPPADRVFTHRSFPPLPPSLRLCLLLRGPRTCTCCCRRRLVQGELPSISSQHRPASGLPGQQRSLPCTHTHSQPTNIHNHTHTHQTHPRTTHQNILGPAPSPSHNSTSSLRPSFRLLHDQNHTQSTPAFPARSLTSSFCPARSCTRHSTCTSPDSSSSTP